MLSRTRSLSALKWPQTRQHWTTAQVATVRRSEANSSRMACWRSKWGTPNCHSSLPRRTKSSRHTQKRIEFIARQLLEDPVPPRAILEEPPQFLLVEEPEADCAAPLLERHAPFVLGEIA